MKLIKEEVAECLRDRALDSVQNNLLVHTVDRVWDCISPNIWKYIYHSGRRRVEYRISMMDK